MLRLRLLNFNLRLRDGDYQNPEIGFVLRPEHKQGSYRSLKCLKVLEIHLCFFKALKSLKNSTFSIMVLKSP